MTVKMSASEATSFERFSIANALTVEVHAKAKGCGCKAYEDWYTYARWQAQGQQVQKGEHGVKIATYAPITAKNDDGDRVVVGKRPWTSTVFCRHQVAPQVSQ